MRNRTFSPEISVSGGKCRPVCVWDTAGPVFSAVLICLLTTGMLIGPLSRRVAAQEFPEFEEPQDMEPLPDEFVGEPPPQGPMGPPPGGMEQQGGPMGGPPAGRMEMQGQGMDGRTRGRGGPQQAVDRWLEQLREHEPEEYEHFMQMREEDPQAFRDAMRERIKEHRMSRGFPQQPDLHQAFMQMPPDQRRNALREIYSGPRVMQQFDNQAMQKNPEIRKLQKETKALSIRFKKSESDEDRQAVREELRTKLGELFDLRTDARKKMLDEMKTKITSLEEKLSARDENRDRIIERRLQDMTEAEELQW